MQVNIPPLSVYKFEYFYSSHQYNFVNFSLIPSILLIKLLNFFKIDRFKFSANPITLNIIALNYLNKRK